MAADINKVVIDASFILARLLPDEKQFRPVFVYFEKFSQGKLIFIAPELLKYEITNSLRSAVAQKRLSNQLSCQILKEFFKLPIIYKNVDFEKVLQLAIKKQISTYDAAYLSLALSQKIPLLSLDKRLSKLVLNNCYLTIRKTK